MSVDIRVKLFIQQQVNEGVTNIREMQRRVKVYVKTQLFRATSAPSNSNRQYFPSRKDLRNIVYKARISQMRSKVDQENLEHLVTQWHAQNAGDKFYFRPYAKNSSSSSVSSDDDVFIVSRGQQGLLYIHQSPDQRRLLAKYGEMVLVDATYKTMTYALPLFVVCVRTNVDYMVVATFVTQFEDMESISEVLDILKSWNSDWKPRSFTVDFNEALIKSLERVFSGTCKLAEWFLGETRLRFALG